MSDVIGWSQLVYRLLNPLGFVAFKMDRRQGGREKLGILSKD
jgi:hypothetical protein